MALRREPPVAAYLVAAATLVARGRPRATPPESDQAGSGVTRPCIIPPAPHDVPQGVPHMRPTPLEPYIGPGGHQRVLAVRDQSDGRCLPGAQVQRNAAGGCGAC